MRAPTSIHRRRTPRPSAGTLGAILLLSIGAALGATAARAADDDVSVVGRTLLKDDRPWTPHGFVQIAFVSPPGAPDPARIFAVAAKDYTPFEYGLMRAAGADSVRIQVAQTGMNPDGLYSSDSFRDRVYGAIRAARAAGLVVIVSMQDEPQTGQPRPAKLPDEGTRRAWRELAPRFARDRGVMFELLNEPELDPSSHNWTLWKDAMERTIRVIRDEGAENVVVADGLQFAETLDGAPMLHDRLDRVVYAAHPYAHASTDQSIGHWNDTFGRFARTAPVLVTEWGIGYFCNDRTPDSTKRLLQYLDRRGIGLEAVTWDWSSATFGSALYDFPRSRLSRFVGPDGAYACHTAAGATEATIPPGDGIGAMVETWYRTGVPPDHVE